MTDHQEIRSLLGAYVLSAVAPLEQRRIERHLDGCEDCAREVRLLGEAATELSTLVPQTDVPSDLVDRIVDSIPAHRRSPSIRTRIAVGIAAAAVAIAGVLGAFTLRESGRNERVLALVANADRQVKLTGQGGFPGRGDLYLKGKEGVLILENVPSAGRSRSYQLWAIDQKRVASMAVVEGEGRIVQIIPWTGTGKRFAVTVEPQGGSARPTTDPILIGA